MSPINIVDAEELARRLIRHHDLVAAENSFIDTRTPGSEHKRNYTIIGRGVAEADQFINLTEPHGFQLGAAAMPPGVNNSLHLHFTAEVFIVVAGEYTFRWGRREVDGEHVGRVGDVLSMPTWVFRGFTNIGGDDNFILTILGRDETGGLIWHPDVLRAASGHGMHLTVENRLIDEVSGDVLGEDVELVSPMSDEQLDRLVHYSPEQMQARVCTSGDRGYVDDALLCTAVDGGRCQLALIIGHGMTERRGHRPRLVEPHGFCLAAVRADQGQGVLLHRHDESQVLYVGRGSWQITLNDAQPVSVRLEPNDTLSIPAGAWRSYVNVSDDPEAELFVIDGGDGRTHLEWSPDVVASARTADVGLDANGTLAPWSLIRHSGSAA